MTKNLLKEPRYWLNLEGCKKLFEDFRQLIEFDEPIPDFDTRFPGRLESILSSVDQTFGDKHLNDSVLKAASSYFNQIVRGHPFQNGNKRMGVLFTHAFLYINGVELTIKQDELYEFALYIASSTSENKTNDHVKKICERVIERFAKDR